MKNKNKQTEDKAFDEPTLETEQSIPEVKTTEPDFQQKYLRLLAEFSNYQKQKEEELRSMAVFSNKSLLLKMIDLLDDMEMGLIQVDLSEDTKNLLEMLKQKFEHTLKVEGVTGIDINPGDAYDPQKCEVIAAVEDENNKAKIVQVIRKGYALSDRVLRTAKVIVGK